jgi:N-acetylglucosaminyldiphosphoundecaprenol N-acetyl-beta-D-mannosaminyltransferase
MLEQQSAKMCNTRDINILGIGFNDLTRVETLDWIEATIRERAVTYICTPNADHLLLSRNDPEFKSLLNKANLVVSDGMGVVYASRILGTPFKENVGGRLLLPDFAAIAAKHGYRIFLLGGRTKEQAQKAAKRLCESYPDLIMPSTYTPPFMEQFDDEETRRILDAIHYAHPDILFVCLGTPKQEKWIVSNIDQLEVPVSIGIGAALDILSEQVIEPPRWMSNIGLEWLFKLVQEPKRLWKRYLLHDPLFIWLVLEQYLNQKFLH